MDAYIKSISPGCIESIRKKLESKKSYEEKQARLAKEAGYSSVESYEKSLTEKKQKNEKYDFFYEVYHKQQIEHLKQHKERLEKYDSMKSVSHRGDYVRTSHLKKQEQSSDEVMSKTNSKINQSSDNSINTHDRRSCRTENIHQNSNNDPNNGTHRGVTPVKLF
jgi:Tfp pilus assembly protein PilV